MYPAKRYYLMELIMEHIHNCPLKGIGMRDICLGDLLCHADLLSSSYLCYERALMGYNLEV